jgi:hypothetical protein
MFVTTITYYTLTRLHWLISQLSITFSNYHRLYIFTLRNSRRELTPWIHFLRLLLNNWLVGLLLKNSLLKTDCLDISVPLINPQSYKCHCSKEQSESCVASSHCVYKALPRKRECCRVTSSRPVAQVPYSNAVAWRHRGCMEKTPPPLLPRSAYSVARRLAVGYLATLCCATQR